MKGGISLGDFILQVRKELTEVQCDPKDAFYALEDVELEVTFGVEAKGDAKGKLVVVELGGSATASQTHKVTLKLKPLARKADATKETQREKGSSFAGGGGGARHFEGSHLPTYEKP